MRVLLDTHVFLWWVADSSRLSARARGLIAAPGNPVFVSVASAWEIATKYRTGKLPEAAHVALDVAGIIAGQGFEELPITIADAERAGRLPGTHRDPFDRMLAAQALGRDLPLVSKDAVLDEFAVQRLW